MDVTFLHANNMHVDERPRTRIKRSKNQNEKKKTTTTYGIKCKRVFLLCLYTSLSYVFLYTLRRTLCQAKACKVVEENTQTKKKTKNKK